MTLCLALALGWASPSDAATAWLPGYGPIVTSGNGTTTWSNVRLTRTGDLIKITGHTASPPNAMGSGNVGGSLRAGVVTSQSQVSGLTMCDYTAQSPFGLVGAATGGVDPLPNTGGDFTLVAHVQGTCLTSGITVLMSAQPGGQVWFTESGPGPDLPAYCVGSDFGDVAAGYSGGQVSVRFKWSKEVPASGWAVTAPAGTALGTLPAAAKVDGRPGYYAGKFALGSAPATVQLQAGSAASGAPGCSVTVTSVGVTDVAPGGSTYGAADPDTGEDCGTFNLFCQVKAALRWAFYVTPETRAKFSALGGTTGGKVPFVYVTGAFSYANAAFADCTHDYPACETWQGFTMHLPDTAASDAHNFTVAAPDDPFVVWLIGIRDVLGAIIWLLALAPLAFYIWRRLFPVVEEG